jgi:hypothetical protein
MQIAWNVVVVAGSRPSRGDSATLDDEPGWIDGAGGRCDE